jgi:hypothetical protein
MSKTQEQRPTQTQTQSPATEVSSPSVESNSAEVATSGLESVGAAPEEMGLMGSFADTILDCMPMIMAMPMARRYAENPAIQEWASRIGLDEVATTLGVAANRMLKEIWPVGTGFDLEAQLKGQIIEGIDGTGHITGMRTGADSLNLSVDGRASVGLAGGGPGLAISDAFGEGVATAMASAGIDLGVHYVAKQTTEFDVLSLLTAPAMIGLTLNDLLSDGLPGVLPVALPQITPILVGAELGIDAWGLQTEYTLVSNAKAEFGSFSEDLAVGVVERALGVGEFAEVAAELLPMLKACAETGLTLAHDADGGFRVEGGGSISAILGALGKVPLVGQHLPAGAHQLLVGKTGGKADIRTRLIFRRTGPLSIALDTEQSGFMLEATQESAGQTTTQQQFLSLAAASTAEECGGCETAPVMDIKKTVKIKVDPAVAGEHCAALMKKISDVADGLLSHETRLFLEGEASLTAKAATEVIGAGVDLPDAAMFAALDMAVCGSAALGSELEPWAGEIAALAGVVSFSGPRLTGHVHQGAGGGVSGSLGGKASGVVRAEAGMVVDMVIEGPDADRIRRAMVGGQAAA